MMQMILKYLWAQRRSNALLLLELTLVGIMLFYVVNAFLDAYGVYRIPLGFTTERSYVINLQKTKKAKITGHQLKDSLDRFLRTRKEIEQFAYTFDSEPFSGDRNCWAIVVDGVEQQLNIRVSDVNFPSLLGVHINEGRWFTEAELLQNSKVCLITEGLKVFLKRPNPVGTMLKFGNPTEESLRIIGVIPDLKYGTYDAPVLSIFRPMDLENQFFFWKIVVKVKEGQKKAFAQTLKLFTSDVSKSLGLVVLSVNDFDTKKQFADTNSTNAIWSMFWCAFFFLVNVILGIYVVFLGRVKKRISELAIRMAVGSTRSGIILLVLGESVLLLMLSSIVVLVVAFNMAHLGVLDSDAPFTVWHFTLDFLLVEFVLLISVVGSVLIPAIKASRVEPAMALHYE
jgi:ABC-type transport system, involved in lipoprotein release, permease component